MKTSKRREKLNGKQIPNRRERVDGVLLPVRTEFLPDTLSRAEIDATLDEINVSPEQFWRVACGVLAENYIRRRSEAAE